MKQCDMIIDYINQHGSISNREAMLELGIGRLASRIYDLKQDGYDIVSKTVKEKNRAGEWKHFARYSIAREES